MDIHNDNEAHNGHNDQRVSSDDGKHDYHHGDEEQGVNGDADDDDDDDWN